VDVVSVKKVKRPAGAGIWRAYVLGTDQFGTWLHTPAGSVYLGDDGKDTGVCEVAQDDDGVGRPIVQLITPGAWWIATWYPPSADRDVTVDICTPPASVGSTCTYTDLELDPWRSRDGQVGTDDWDEFHAAHTAGWIDQHELVAAQAAAEMIEGLLQERTEPYGRTGHDLLKAATDLGLPHLTL
jgi:hypothetical protein